MDDTKIRNDLRRASLAMAVAAIDAYMHRLVFKRLSEVRYAGDLPESLREFDVPFSDLAALADAALNARRDANSIRPWVQVKNAMQKELLTRTFQSFEQISTALALAGVKKGLARAARSLNCTSNDIQARLNRIVLRRNQIVHEGDITRSSRPRSLRFNAVNHNDIVADVDWIEQLLQAIDTVVAAGNPEDHEVVAGRGARRAREMDDEAR